MRKRTHCIWEKGGLYLGKIQVYYCMKKIIYRFVALTAIFIGLSACKKDEVILNLTYESEEIAA